MFVIIVLGWQSFTFKDSRVLLSWRVDRWSDSSQHPCILASVPQRAHAKPFPCKLLFAEPDALCFSLFPPIAGLLVLLARDPERPHGFQLCWGTRNTFLLASTLPPVLPAPRLVNSPFSSLCAQGWPRQNSALCGFNSLFLPQAASALMSSCLQLTPPNPPHQILTLGKHLVLEFRVING